MSVTATGDQQQRVLHLPDETTPVLDGQRPLKVDELIALARKRMVAGANWLSRSLGPDGRFAYYYYPETDKFARRSYNEVRHAGTTYSLFQSYELENEQRWLDAAERACAWIRQSSEPSVHGGLAFVYQDRMKLGGQALALVALLERRRVLQDHGYDDLIANLAILMDAMELPSSPGQYYQSLDAKEQQLMLLPASDYYPGEALLAMTRLAQHFPDGPFLEQAIRAGKYLIHVKDGDIVAAREVPRHDHWLAMALSELFQLHPEPGFALVAYLQANAMIASQYPPTHDNWRQIGGSRRGKSVNYTSTATKAEAMNAVWSLASHLGDAETAARVSEAALRTIQFQMRVQYTTELAGNFPNPRRVVGAWAQDEKESRVRADFVQHNISALAGAIHLVERGRLPMALADTHAKYVSEKKLAAPVVEVYRGASVWSSRPVVHLVLDSRQALESGEIPLQALSERIGQLFGTMQSGNSETRQPRNIGEALAFLMLGLQKLGGWNVELAGAAEQETAGHYDVYAEYEDAIVAEKVASLSLTALDDLLQGRAPSSAFFKRFDSSVAKPSLDHEAGDIERFRHEARRRSIPMFMPIRKTNMLEFGTGQYQKRIWRLFTGETPTHGVQIAGNKGMANEMLLDRGLPVPANRVVTSLDQAVKVARKIGYPVVLKPLSRNHSKGVVPNIRNEEELREFYPWTRSFTGSGNIVVEQFVEGISYRILVIDYKVFAVLDRRIASVTGDGTHTIEQLIELENAKPERQLRDGNELMPIHINDHTYMVLSKQGLALSDVPEAGREIQVKLVPSGSNGGTRVDVTETIHPDNAAIAVQSCRMLGLDLGGLDFVAPDIAKSVWETGGGIVEINSAPGLYPHYRPTSGVAVDPVPAIMEMFYPLDAPVRAPVVAVAGQTRVNDVAELIADLLTANGETVGRSHEDGAVIGAMRTKKQTFGPTAAHVVLRNPAVETAVLAVTESELVYPGLEIDQIDVAVFSDMATPPTGHGAVSAERVLLDLTVLGGTIIASAEDAAKLPASALQGRTLILAGETETTEIDDHVAAGGVAVVGRSGGAALLRGPENEDIFPGRSDKTDLLAIAAAVAHGVDSDTIRRGLTTRA